MQDIDCIFEQVEKSRHVLLLREKLAEQNKTQELSKLDKEASNKSKKAKHDQEKEEILNKSDISEDKSVEKWEKDDATEKYERQGHGVYNFTTDGSREQELTAKCLRYILQGKSLLSPPTPKVCVCLFLFVWYALRKTTFEINVFYFFSFLAR